MNLELTADVRKRLDGHLDAVEAALSAAGRSREERRAIVDDLESQIVDMLAAKGTSPAMAHLETVLAGLDPPSAYGEGGSGAEVLRAPAVAKPLIPAHARPRYSRVAIWGLVLILVSLLPLLSGVALWAFLVTSLHAASVHSGTLAQSPSQTVDIYLGPSDRIRVESPTQSVAETGPAVTRSAMTSPSPPQARMAFGYLPCLGVLFIPLAMAGTVMGWIAFFQIRASAGAVQGAGLALFDGLLYPVLMTVGTILFVA